MGDVKRLVQALADQQATLAAAVARIEAKMSVGTGAGAGATSSHEI